MHIFGPFEDIMVYIDNIILFTKGSFDHHVKRLACVLELLRKNNLHVHVEETFLASDKVDYLGYTLTTSGIKPQLKKILPILRFSKPKTVKQLRGFLGTDPSSFSHPRAFNKNQFKQQQVLKWLGNGTRSNFHKDEIPHGPTSIAPFS